MEYTRIKKTAYNEGRLYFFEEKQTNFWVSSQEIFKWRLVHYFSKIDTLILPFYSIFK